MENLTGKFNLARNEYSKGWEALLPKNEKISGLKNRSSYRFKYKLLCRYDFDRKVHYSYR